MIYALYHDSGETAGLISDVLRDCKVPFRAAHIYRGDGLPRETSGLDGLIVMGGPMNVDEVDRYPFLLPEIQLIEAAIKDGKPVLGICLGAQLMAKALGADVYQHSVREVGWRPIEVTAAAAADPLFRQFPKRFNVMQWHGDTFDLPKDAVHLARSSACENQAFRWGNNAYALQFHLEATPEMVSSWCRSKGGAAYVKSAGEDTGKIVESSASVWKRLRPVAYKFFSSYTRRCFQHQESLV